MSFPLTSAAAARRVSLTIEGEGPVAMTLGAFVADNADMDEALLDSTIVRILNRVTATGGGGAQPAWTLEPDPIEALKHRIACAEYDAERMDVEGDRGGALIYRQRANRLSRELADLSEDAKAPVRARLEAAVARVAA